MNNKYFLIERTGVNKMIVILEFNSLEDLIRHRDNCKNDMLAIIRGEILFGTMVVRNGMPI